MACRYPRSFPLLALALVAGAATASGGVTPAAGGTVRDATHQLDFSIGLVAAPMASGGDYVLQSSVLVADGAPVTGAIFRDGFDSPSDGANR